MPAALVLLCFVKKLTVIGIIGNTQGVSKAANPEKKAIKKMLNKPLFVFGASTGVSVAFLSGLISPVVGKFVSFNKVPATPLTVNFKLTSVGGKQFESSQTIKFTTSLSTSSLSVNKLIRCLKTASFSKYLITILNTLSCSVCPSPSVVFPIS